MKRTTAAVAGTTLLSMPAAAERLGCSRTYVYRLIASGQLRSVDIKAAGNTRSKTRVRAEDVEAFIERHTA
jgi:excisionase family DNA binding protein